MNTTKRSRGSILLETLISIVILGLIAGGSIFSYSFVYQRIHSQRRQREILGVLQGWMEYTISSLLDPNNLKEEDDFRQKFKEDISKIFYPNTYIDPDIAINPIDDDIKEIRIWITLSNTKEVSLSKGGLRITLYTQNLS